MIYNYQKTLNVSLVQKIKKTALVLTALLAVSTTFMSLSAAHAATSTLSFSAADLAANWGPERIAPSGGYSSLATFQGRSNVAEIKIDSTNVNPDVYYRTEGIKSEKGTADNFDAPGDFGQTLSVDLYLDPMWDSNAVRAGLWTVGDNGSNGTDAANYPFGTVEFANVAGYEGYRYFDPSTGWVNVPGFKTKDYGKWVTFTIRLDSATDRYVYSINGTEVGSSEAPAPSMYLYSAILNQRNFGLDPQTGLTTNNYSVHWSSGVTSMTLQSKDDCKNNGWKTGTLANNNGTFKNQGDCVSYFATNGKNQPAGTSTSDTTSAKKNK